MENYYLHQDIKVAGREVKTFPLGIKEAFDALIRMLPEGEGRPCFGLSKMTDHGDITYIAAIEQKEKDEFKNNNCLEYSIEKGEYLAETLTNWMDQLDSIQGIFTRLMSDDRTNSNTYCIEWYKNETEMMCLLKKQD